MSNNVRMENMGRPADGRIGPVGIEHIYRDPDTPLAVDLLVDRQLDRKQGPFLRGQHWAISWTIPEGLRPRTDGFRVHRVLHIVREVGCDHYTNWGPWTRSFDPTVWETVHIAEMTLSQRRSLEAVAARTEVCVPNGVWNCQDWVIEVLEDAVTSGLLSAEQRDAALRVAQC